MIDRSFGFLSPDGCLHQRTKTIIRCDGGGGISLARLAFTNETIVGIFRTTRIRVSIRRDPNGGAYEIPTNPRLSLVVLSGRTDTDRAGKARAMIAPSIWFPDSLPHQRTKSSSVGYGSEMPVLFVWVLLWVCRRGPSVPIAP